MLRLSRFLVALSLTLAILSCQCQGHLHNSPEVAKYETVLNAGIARVKQDITLRDAFIKRGFDFQNATHIQELESQMSTLSAFYRDAAKGRLANNVPLSQHLEKVLKQMNETFANKTMSLRKWVLFHIQLSMVFSEDSPNRSGFAKVPGFEYGKLDDKMDIGRFGSLLNARKVFPSFVYAHDGVLGLATLNLAFANDILVIASATDPDLVADTRHMSAFTFTQHDLGHFFNFNDSHYPQERYLGKLNAIYETIEKQKNARDRLRDHLGFFYLVHEFPMGVFSRDIPKDYTHSIEEVLRLSYEGQVMRIREITKRVSGFFDEFAPFFKDVLPANEYIQGNDFHNFQALNRSFLSKYAPPSPLKPAQSIFTLDKTKLESALTTGMDDAVAAVTLRDKIEARKESYNENNIPELEQQLPRVMRDFEALDIANYLEPSRVKTQFKKMVQDLKKQFAAKKVTLTVWSSFLSKARYIARNPSYLPLPGEVVSDPLFLFYTTSASKMGLQTKNYVETHELLPFAFDGESFSYARIDAFLSKGRLKGLYDTINADSDLVSRAQKNVALKTLLEYDEVIPEAIESTHKKTLLLDIRDLVFETLHYWRFGLKEHGKGLISPIADKPEWHVIEALGYSLNDTGLPDMYMIWIDDLLRSL